MSNSLDITVTNVTSGATKKVQTDSCVILYLDADRIKITGDIDLKALAPIIMKFAMEKMSK